MARKGSEHHSHKLDESAVRDILRNPKLTLGYFAKKYDVSIVAVWKVRARITWSHVKVG